MDLTEKYKKDISLIDKDLNEKTIAQISRLTNSTYELGLEAIESNGLLNELFIKLFEASLSNNLLKNENQKLDLIKLLSDLNLKNEIIQSIKNKNHSSIKKASEKMGHKFMSSIKK